MFGIWIGLLRNWTGGMIDHRVLEALAPGGLLKPRSIISHRNLRQPPPVPLLLTQRNIYLGFLGGNSYFVETGSGRS
ncbi:hypothetical protein Mapa_014219 [Marchantia paleacea]|nr:hypothetical protein Mapa_014219 [Marchantia paleacea]